MATLVAPPLDQIAPRNSQDPDESSLAHHRRIELQSPADLVYLMNNVSRAARAKIDLHLPLEAALREGDMGVDEMRRTVETEVQKWVNAVFEGAKSGISVNGVEAERVEWEREVPEEFEPYDTRLAARMSALHAKIEQLNLSLANTRRTAAAHAALEYKRKYTAQSEGMDDAMAKRQKNLEHQIGNGESLADLRYGFEGREGEVVHTWEKALEGLIKIETGLQGTTAEARRAVDVVATVEER